MANRTTEAPSDQEKIERYLKIVYHFVATSRCRWCLLPYPSGYVCYCGWDNSYNPDSTEPGHIEYKNKFTEKV